MSFTELLIPAVTVIVILWGLKSGTDIFSEFIAGAKENLTVCMELLPTLIALITAVGMFTASGASELLTNACSGTLMRLGFPPECLPLALIRPVSGSGALAVYESVLSHCGPDSLAGKVASVMIGSTETTFYTIAVYYGAVGIKKTRHTVPAAIIGDITGFVVSVIMVGILL